MDTGQTPDVAAIASRVLAALEQFEPLREREEPEQSLAVAHVGGMTLTELAMRVERLSWELGRLRLRQQRLENAIAHIDEQMRMLPAHLLRLERWSTDVDAHIERLSGAAFPVERGGVGSPHSAPADEAPEKWMTVREVAHVLQVQENTVRRYIRQGKLPATHLPKGRHLRIPWSSVEEHLVAIRQDVGK